MPGVAAVIVLPLVLGVPIAAAILLGAFYALGVLDLPAHIVAQRIFNQLQVNAFLAIPFFVLTGELMVRTGMARVLVDVAKALVGHRRGGLAQSSIVLSVGFAGVSGSAVADAAFESKVLVPEMRKAGYDGPWSAALIAAGSAIGPIIPPSVALVIYAAMTGMPVGPLFLGGIVPGLLIGAAYMITCSIQSRKRFEKGRWVGLSALALAVRKAFWGMLAPIIIVGGIVGGIFTATEAGAIAVAYVALVGLLVYRSLSWKDLQQALEQSAITSGAVMLIIVAASILAWLLGFVGLPRMIGGWMEALPGPVWVAVVSVVAVVVLGTVVESMAVGILLIPVLHPLAVGLGLDPVYFALILVLGIVLGALTPPIGLLLFVTSSATGERLEQVSRQVLPYVLAFLVVLALCVAFPQLITWLPELILSR